MRSRKRAIFVSSAALFAVLAWIIWWGASESSRAADLAQENAGLRAELVATQDALDEALVLLRDARDDLNALTVRIGILEDEIRRLGGQVPASTTVIVDDQSVEPAPAQPPPTTTTTSRTSTSTTEPPCRATPLGICIPNDRSIR